MKKIPVSEKFYSIQGEGQTMGIPAVFLRLGGCNLLCQSDKWICDTIEVWRKSKAKMFEDVLSEEDYARLIYYNAHLVITGGEPLLHEKNIVSFIEWIVEKKGVKPIIEIETNGTIKPSEELNKYVDYWNVSPKLDNAGKQNSLSIRRNPDALSFFSNQGRKTIFKFVIHNQEDMNNIFDHFAEHINSNQIMLMPAGSSQQELNQTRQYVAETAKELGYRYCDRLHVVIWNLKTGV